MQPDNAYAPGFVSVDEAIKLIKADKREDAKVDLQFLVNNLPYLKVKWNYNIRLLKTTPEGKVVRNGEVYVTIHDNYEREILARAITDAFTQRTGIALKEGEMGVNKVTTMIDQEKEHNDVRPRENLESDTKVGQDISNPVTQVLQGV